MLLVYCKKTSDPNHTNVFSYPFQIIIEIKFIYIYIYI